MAGPRLPAALAAARRGWHVFPLHPFSKYPRVERWQEQATDDPERIEEWWAQTPFANIGLACGPSGLVVVDLDSARGDEPPPAWACLGARHGRDVLRILAERAGEPDPVDTYTVRTPRGGEHRYFLAPTDVPLLSTAGVLGWRVDTRAWRGCIVAAGSGAKIDGRLRLYGVMRRTEVAPLPGWLAAALTPPLPPPRTPIVPPPSGTRRVAYFNAALAGEALRVEYAAPGSRAVALFTAARNLGQLVGAGVLDHSTASEALVVAARGHIGVDGFTGREAASHIRNGLTSGARQPRMLPFTEITITE